MATAENPLHAAALGHGHAGALTPGQAGMLAFLLTEVAFFSTLIMSYVFFLRQTVQSVPGPGEVFYLPLVLVSSFCLFSSSATVHMADKALRTGARARFLGFWGLTIFLGLAFLAGTAYEWTDLIGKHGL